MTATMSHVSIPDVMLELKELLEQTDVGCLFHDLVSSMICCNVINCYTFLL